MDKKFEELLADCLAELDAHGGDIEACLGRYPGQENALRPYLEFRRTAASQPLSEPSPAAEAAGRAAVAKAAARWSSPQTGTGAGATLPGSILRPVVALAGAGMVVLAALLIVGGSLLPGALQFGAPAAEAHELEGTLTIRGDGWLGITTSEGTFRILVTGDTILLDEVGLPVSHEQIALGSPIETKVREGEDRTLEATAVVVDPQDDGIESGLLAENYVLFLPGDEVEFLATIAAVSGTSVAVDTAFDGVTVVVTEDTEIAGTLEAGASVTVLAIFVEDGTFLGREVHVEEETDGPGASSDDGGPGVDGSDGEGGGVQPGVDDGANGGPAPAPDGGDASGNEDDAGEPDQEGGDEDGEGPPSDGGDDVSTPVPTTKLAFYLHSYPTPPTGDTTSKADLPLSLASPTAAALYNYDTDRDDSPGLVIENGGTGVTESDPTKYQAWRTSALGSALTIQGDVILRLWSAVNDFEEDDGATVIAYLRDFNGSTYTEIAQATLTELQWQSVPGTWSAKTFVLPVGFYTVAAGHRLELKIVVDDSSDDDLWFAYDTLAYPSRLLVPTQ